MKIRTAQPTANLTLIILGDDKTTIPQEMRHEKIPYNLLFDTNVQSELTPIELLRHKGIARLGNKLFCKTHKLKQAFEDHAKRALPSGVVLARASDATRVKARFWLDREDYTHTIDLSGDIFTMTKVRPRAEGGLYLYEVREFIGRGYSALKGGRDANK